MSLNYRIIMTIAAICLAASLVGCPLVNQTTVTVTADETSLEVGATTNVTATSTNSADTSFTWAIDDEDVVAFVTTKDDTVSIEALAAGTAVVTATGDASGVSDSVTITVTEPSLNTSHEGKFTEYVGATTCVTCHPGKDTEVHASVHYQWNSEDGGKMTGINGFCTYPAVNFIGLLTNADGVTVNGGCAQCHVGMGVKPALDATPEQLANIDCLICHSESYKRKVVKHEDGSFGFAPDEAAMGDVLAAITNIKRVSNTTCLNCHAKAGGGPNNKRGDIEPEHYNPSADFDVHLASIANGGAGLTCVDCHAAANHRIAGRGVDLRPTDSPTVVRCESCHEAEPHESDRLNAHTARVDCTVCHIPHYARGASGTDMYRDFTDIELDESKKLYEPIITRAANVVPDYEFWDGTSFISMYGDPVAVDENDGTVIMAAPGGDIATEGAKLFPFKVHGAIQPMRTDDLSLIGLKMGVLFQHGAFDTTTDPPALTMWNMEAEAAQVIDASIRIGASQAGNPLPAGDGAYEFVETKRYMGIFHEVAPATEALSCGECHFGGTRIDFDRLGYALKDNPNLCATCHADYSDVWDESELFTEVHEEHVDELGLNCSVCHNFAAAK